MCDLSNVESAWFGPQNVIKTDLIHSQSTSNPWQAMAHTSPTSQYGWPPSALAGGMASQPCLIERQLAELGRVKTSEILRADVFREEGDRHSVAGDFCRALIAYELAIRLNPCDGRAWMNKAGVHFERKQWGDLVYCSAKAAGLGYGGELAYFRTATAQLNLGDLRLAELHAQVYCVLDMCC